MKVRNLVAALGAAGALVAGSAAPAVAAPICRAVKVGDGSLVYAELCVEVEVLAQGATVAPTVHVTCKTPDWLPALRCDYTASVSKTGLETGGSYVAPEVDPTTGSVRVHDGSVDLLWVDGTLYSVPIVGFCVGDPAFCA